MWRRVLRPVLRFAWVGRIVSLLAFVAGVALVLLILRRAVRALALVAVAFTALAADAQGLIDFEAIERQMMRGHEEMLRMRQEMESMMMNGGFGGGGMSMTINGRKVEPPKVSVTVKPAQNRTQSDGMSRLAPSRSITPPAATGMVHV